MASYGFTGTLQGMTPVQKRMLAGYLVARADDIDEAHHGDAIGADKEFNDMIRNFKPTATVVIHPPSNSSRRAFCLGDKIRPSRGYLARNRDIVTESDILLATPSTSYEKKRSGTWYTIRQARKAEHDHIIFFPDGTMKEVTYDGSR